VKKAEITPPDAPAAITCVFDEQSILLGDLVFSSVAGDYKIKKLESKGNIGDNKSTVTPVPYDR